MTYIAPLDEASADPNTAATLKAIRKQIGIVLSNFANNVARTQIDFPVVEVAVAA